MIAYSTDPDGCGCVLRVQIKSQLCFLLLVVLSAGCSDEAAPERPKPVAAVSWNASKLTSLAFEKLDADKNERLTANEQSPGLRAALPKIDADNDGAIAKPELEKRLAAHMSFGAGLVSAAGTVTLSGAPAAGIKVTLEPEPFMAAVCKSASGVTDQNGDFALQAEGSPVPAAQPGIYLIRLQSPDGKIAIPERFSTATTLGVEISAENVPHLRLDLAP